MRDRKQLRSHIRAAREWLGQADRSLERENDLQGDLKLMLARAELQRAKESLPVSLWRRFGSRLLPLAVASVLAAAFYLQPEAPEVTAGNEATEANYAASAKVPALAVQETVPVSGAGGEPDFLEKAHQDFSDLPEAVEASEPVRVEAEPMQEPGPESFESPVPAGTMEREAQLPRMPSEDMQKLMQSAGKVLRAE